MVFRVTEGQLYCDVVETFEIKAYSFEIKLDVLKMSCIYNSGHKNSIAI